ncbi:MAG: DUF1476 domain-containing protein [Pseudomonadota bacterium]
MAQFDDREKAFESKFAHDAEMQFKAEARRNKLLGLWAADKMGMGEADAEAYAKQVIAADFEEAGDEDVYRKVAKDFADKGVAVPEAELRAQMREFLTQAKESLAGDAKA